MPDKRTIYIDLAGRLDKYEASLKRAEQKTTDASKKLSGAFKGIAAAAVAAFSVQQIADFTKEVVTLASKVEGVRAAFDRLNDSNLLANLRKHTRNTVSDFDLMKAAVQAKNFKIPLESLGTYLEFAQKRAAQTGESVDYLVRSLITGLGRKSALVLDNLGISAITLQNEVRRVGDFGKAAGNIIREELAGMGDIALTTADKFSQVSAEWENIKVIMGEFFIGATYGFIDFIDNWTIAGRLQNQYNEELERTQRISKNLMSMYAGAVGEARARAGAAVEGRSAAEINQMINDLDAKIRALKNSYNMQPLTGDQANDLEQLNAQMQIYVSAYEKLTYIFDSHGKTVSELKIRINELNAAQENLVPGSAVYIENLKEIKRLQETLKLDAGIDPWKRYGKSLGKTQGMGLDRGGMFTVNIPAEMKAIDEITAYKIIHENNISDFIESSLTEQYNMQMGHARNIAQTLQQGFERAGSDFLSTLMGALDIAIQIAQAIKASKSSDVLGSISGFMGPLGGLFSLLFHEGGTVVNRAGKLTREKIPHFAAGGSFIVPGGYPNDSYPIMVESGERVTVTPASVTNNFNMNAKVFTQILSSIQALNMNLMNKGQQPIIINAGLDGLTFTERTTNPNQRRLNKEASFDV